MFEIQSKMSSSISFGCAMSDSGDDESLMTLIVVHFNHGGQPSNSSCQSLRDSESAEGDVTDM